MIFWSIRSLLRWTLTCLSMNGLPRKMLPLSNTIKPVITFTQSSWKDQVFSSKTILLYCGSKKQSGTCSTRLKVNSWTSWSSLERSKVWWRKFLLSCKDTQGSRWLTSPMMWPLLILLNCSERELSSRLMRERSSKKTTRWSSRWLINWTNRPSRCSNSWATSRWCQEVSDSKELTQK